MACPEYLKQHILRNGIPQTLEDIKEFADELKAKAQERITAYEADERDYYVHDKACKHCNALETAVTACNEKA